MPTALSDLPVQDGFRLRGEAVSRLETFVDAAFAFALTLMVISVGELPKSLPELLMALKRLPAFAACFALLMIFWTGHNRWSRRYGLENGRTNFLSFLLVFSVMVWIFPLRMVMSGAMHFMSGQFLPTEMKISSSADLQGCFLIYGLGFGVLCAAMLELSRAAMARADELSLDSFERLETRRDIGSHAILLASAVASVALTFVVRDSGNFWEASPGFVYWLIGPAMYWHHRRFHKLRKTLPPRLF